MHQQWLKRILPKIIFLLLFSTFNLSLSMAEVDTELEENEVLVVGTGTIVDGNVAKARKIAISAALVKGVEGYLARRLGSHGMINYFPRLLHDVIPKAREEIENFHILAEERMDNQYKILVRVKINDNVMEEKLREIGLILMEGPPIRVLFLVSQIEPSQGKLSYWWKDPESDSGLTPTELALYRVFQERGFHPINRLLNAPEGEYSSEMQVLDLSDDDAIRWGALFSADVVIHGRCEIMEGQEVSLFLKALNVENGIMIYDDIQTEKIDEGLPGMDQIIGTIEKAIDNVAIRLSPEIIRAIEMPEAKINRFEMALKGLKSFKQFREFRGFLEKNMAGVKSVKQTRIRDNSLYISVEFSGDKDKFLNLISNHEKLPFAVNVTRTEGGEIFVIIR